MENEEKDIIVEIDSINLPVFIFHGESTDLDSNICFELDEDGNRILVTSEEKAKDILFNSIVQSKEEQEALRKIQYENGLQSSVVEIELDYEEKSFIKNFTYTLSLLFKGYSESGKPIFTIVQDTITGDNKKTLKVLSNSKITSNQLNLF